MSDPYLRLYALKCLGMVTIFLVTGSIAAHVYQGIATALDLSGEALGILITLSIVGVSYVKESLRRRKYGHPYV